MVNYSSIFPISSGGGSIAGFEWAERTADFTAEANRAYYVDTALGDVLMTLPSNPAPGDEVAFLLIGANKVNVTSADKIKSSLLATNFARQTGQQYLLFVLFYVDATTGWDWNSRYDSYIGNAYVGDGDPYFNNVVLFLKGDGANNSTAIVDSSLTPKTITRFGDTKISTAQSKYGGSSILFDGSGDYLTVPSSSDWAFGTGDFTIEAWVRISALTFENSSYRAVIASNYQGASGGWTVQVAGSSNSVATHLVSGYADTTLINAPIPNIVNTFSHVAVSRSGTTLRGFVGGVKVAETSNSTNYAITSSLLIGLLSLSLTFWDFNGYQDSLRITKGVGRYTIDFDPETETFLDL